MTDQAEATEEETGQGDAEAGLVGGARAQALLDGAHTITLADPGYHCGKHCPEMPVSGTCHGEHPTGRLTMLVIDAGEERERVLVSEPGDAALLGAAPALARTVVVRERERDDARREAAALRAHLTGRATAPNDYQIEAANAAEAGWMVCAQLQDGRWTRPQFVGMPEQIRWFRDQNPRLKRWTFVDTSGLAADWPEAAPPGSAS